MFAPAGAPRSSYSPWSLLRTRSAVASTVTLTAASGAPAALVTLPRMVPVWAASAWGKTNSDRDNTSTWKWLVGLDTRCLPLGIVNT